MSRKKKRKQQPALPDGLRLMTPLDYAQLVGAYEGWGESTICKVARGEIEPLSDEAKRSPLIALLPKP